MTGPLAPIVLFAFQRPEHTRRTIEALQRNPEARQSILWIFADGPRSGRDAEKVEETRRILRGVSGFGEIRLCEREENFGLTRSIRTGITQAIEEAGRVIVVEDDIVTAPSFLSYMNAALSRYEHMPLVQSISAHNLPHGKFAMPKGYEYDVYASPRPYVWGWGTWRDRWERVDWSMTGAERLRHDRSEQRALDVAGKGPAKWVRMQCDGELNSWDIPWIFDHHIKGGLSIHPVYSYVENIGMDGTGVHCTPSDEFRQDLSRAIRNPRFMPHPYVDPGIMAACRKFYARPPVIPREIDRILKQAGLPPLFT